MAKLEKWNNRHAIRFFLTIIIFTSPTVTGQPNRLGFMYKLGYFSGTVKWNFVTNDNYAGPQTHPIFSTALQTEMLLLH